MKKSHDIKLSYNANINTHSLKRIVGYYYDEYVELNEKFENMTEDEYTRLMFSKINRSKNEKEREKITKEYQENVNKYYPYKKPYSVLSFNDRINILNGYIEFKSEDIEEQYELPLLDFISYNLNNINEYIVFFINYLDLFIDIIDKEDLEKIKLNTLYEIKFISDLAKKYYDKSINELTKKQKIFKDCINFVYLLKINTQTEDLIKNLTKEQRFFVYNQTNNNPFLDFSHKFTIIDSLDYTYKNIPFKTMKTIISLINVIDPDGTELSHMYQYEIDNLYTAFYITLYNIIGIKNWHIKICGNCGRYFLTQKENVSYCERIVTGNNTCKDIGKKEYQKRKQESDETYRKYRTIGTRKKTRASRNPEIEMYQKDLEQFRKTGTKMYKDFCNGKISQEEFAKWVEEQDK